MTRISTAVPTSSRTRSRSSRTGQRLYKTFALDPFFKLSTRPPKSMDGRAVETAERALHDALKANGLAYDLNPGDGAFYGPRSDVQNVPKIARGP